MTPKELFTALNKAGLVIRWLGGDNLTVEPRHRLTPEITAGLAEHRALLRALYSIPSTDTTDGDTPCARASNTTPTGATSSTTSSNTTTGAITTTVGYILRTVNGRIVNYFHPGRMTDEEIDAELIGAMDERIFCPPVRYREVDGPVAGKDGV